MGVLFYDESLGILKLIGVVLAIIGVMLVVRKGVVQEQSAPLPQSSVNN